MALTEYMRNRLAFIESGRPLPEKKKYVLNKVSPKRQAKINEQKEAGGENEMDKFFSDMRKKMKNKCLFCGSTTMKNDDEKFRFSIAHLLPKRPVDKGGFPSVSTHEDNWIELCFYGNSCHTNFDNGIISWEFIKDSKEWDIIKEKLLNVLPQVAEEERKNKVYSRIEKLVYEK